MEDNPDVALRPGLPFRAMNVRLPSSRKVCIVLLATFALFALLAYTSSFATITAFATSALKSMPSPGKVPIQISNCTFNYVASAASDRRNKNTIYFESLIRNTILGVAWWMISRVFIAVVVLAPVLLICTVLHEKLHEENERMKALGRVACLAVIHALGFGIKGVKVDTDMSTTVTTSETPYATTVHTTVTLTVTEIQSKERPVSRSPLGYHL